MGVAWEKMSGARRIHGRSRHIKVAAKKERGASKKSTHPTKGKKIFLVLTKEGKKSMPQSEIVWLGGRQ